MHRDFLFEYLPKGGAAAEIGVHLGDFARRLLDLARPDQLHLIDPWRRREEAAYAAAWYGEAVTQAELDRRHAHVTERFGPEIAAGRVVIHRAASAEALEGFADGALDWIYIDGDHCESAVARDLALALQKVRPGGLILGDDYGVPGWWDDGVTRAVDAVIAAGGADKVTCRNGQFVLRVPGGGTNAALFVHPDMIGDAETAPIGRRVAGKSFLEGYLRHAGRGRLALAAETGEHLDAFETFARDRGWTGPIDAMSAHAPARLAMAGALMLPGPNLADAAWVRRRHGDAAYSLAGVAHTVATRRIAFGLFENLVAPVQPWDAIVCPSRAVRDVIQSHLEAGAAHLRERFAAADAPTPQLPVIPLGVDAGAFGHDPKERAEWRALYAPASDAVVVMTMARFSVYEKMHVAPLLIALERVAARTARPLALWLVGWFANAEDERLYRGAVAELAPSVHIRLLDGRDAGVRATIWNGADLFAHPVDNLQETFGIAPVEAMAAGLPVVAADWDGLRDTVADGETGFLVPTAMAPAGDGGDLAAAHADGRDGYLDYLGKAQQRTVVDIDAMADAFVRLADDAGLRTRLGAAGRRRARDVFDWPRIIHQYEALWAELAERRAAARAPGAAADPAAIDPFRLYRSYPSRSVSPNDRLEAATAATPADIARMLELTGALPDAARPDAAGLATVLTLVAEAPVSVAAMSERLGLDAEAARAAALWLAKFGFLRIVAS